VTTKQAWGAFWVLGLIWGSSFLFIRIGVEQLPPFQLVFIRTAIAAIGLNGVLLLRGKHLPTDRKSIRDMIVLGIVNTVLPFGLITWGEQSISSGIASVLQGTAAFFTLIVAHFVFADERITNRKLIGLLLGFGGVITLSSRSLSEGGLSASFIGELAIVAASFCYALGGTYGRKAIQNRLEPMMAAAGAMTIAAITTGILAHIAPLLNGPAPVLLSSLRSDVVIATLLLGLLNTFVAYLVYYSILEQLGAARTSMVTYIVPVVGLILGAIILHEEVDSRLILGAALIFAGIGVVNLRLNNKWMKRARPN
jgi:drug/metabolite transporter (DMT)-like permease